ncbi:hypothetical protein IFM51744_00813 [Aspergillus udagawae]|nr:hypothetical protein IFM51744_00813 [Aspergillus udagawae]GFG15166.1 hypothetical protein IFM5058_07315 [Aspergillus udagawae]
MPRGLKGGEGDTLQSLGGGRGRRNDRGSWRGLLAQRLQDMAKRSGQFPPLEGARHTEAARTRRISLLGTCRLSANLQEKK